MKSSTGRKYTQPNLSQECLKGTTSAFRDSNDLNRTAYMLFVQ